jgi:hypothetical protein
LRHFRANEAQQLRAWEQSIALLRSALVAQPDITGWHLILEYPMLRLGRRADAILLTHRAILVLEFKAGATSFDPTALRQAEDFALDLQDFHAGSRRHPIIPLLVATDATPRPTPQPLPLAHGTWPVAETSGPALGATIARLFASAPEPNMHLDAGAWLAAPYRPVPTIIEAACMLYGRHGVAEIAAARADATNLTRTTQAILAALAQGRDDGEKIICFVTGIPGAGKTLCGLNAALGAPMGQTRATFLTGNPTLVHVLREALAQDAIGRGADPRATRHRMEGVIQALPRFRDTHAPESRPPPEDVVVIDEAQRCWSRAYAIAKSRDRAVRLTDSEPGHLLAIMGRHPGFAAVICLIGGGQEIHTGEGGLAEWGEALRGTESKWHVHAPPDLLHAPDPRQHLGPLERLTVSPELHLSVPIRQIRSEQAAGWVNAMLAGDTALAAGIAASTELPFALTRSLAALRAWLRAAAHGTRRAGLLASAGAHRLRAEGLGAELPHMDAKAVAHWFLDHYPADIRASDALELVATEFSCQGLELDYAGLCWDGDLIRERGRAAWRVRAFRGTNWTIPTGAEAIANQLNTYRVLLTRARYETIIFVPGGDATDRTRAPAVYDEIAAYLRDCGVGDLTETALVREQKKESVLF